MMYSVKQIAEMLRVGIGVVNCYVDSAELDAIDVNVKRGKNRRLRIPEDALRQFLERRRVYVPPPRSRAGHRAKPRQVIDFFAVPKLEENGRRRLKVSDVAEYLGVTEDHVRQLIAYGHLTAVNVGGTAKDNRYRIAERELFAFIERSRNKPKYRKSAEKGDADLVDDLENPQGESGSAGHTHVT